MSLDDPRKDQKVTDPQSNMNQTENDEKSKPYGDTTEEDNNTANIKRSSHSSLVHAVTDPVIPHKSGKVELKEADCYESLGFCFPWWKKWSILTVIFIVQLSMNFNTSVYSNVVTPLSEHFHISEQAARIGQMIFLVLYAFGSELWAPFSEEFGRWPILQLSLFLVNIWQIPCALAPNFGTIIVCRGLGGLSSAGGSVTLGMTADLFPQEEQQYAVAYVVLSSVGGTTIGPIFGAFIERYLDWRWNFWIQLIFGGVTQAMHFFVPETRASTLMDREAQFRRKSGQDPNIYGPNELKEQRITLKGCFTLWARPFIMFFTEPIVLCLSLLSGFSDALIFTFLESFKPVFQQWGFGTIEVGLAFVPILIGYVVAYVSFLPWIYRDQRIRSRDPDALSPESRLFWLLFTAPLETIGLFGFAWTSIGPPEVHWIAPMIFAFLIAIANYAIYMATIDYMVAAYGHYSASATGGNALARDFLAGISALYATPFYQNIGTTHRLSWPSTILGVLALIVTIPIYVFYWKGPYIRSKSKFAQQLESERKEVQHIRRSRSNKPHV